MLCKPKKTRMKLSVVLLLTMYAVHGKNVRNGTLVRQIADLVRPAQRVDFFEISRPSAYINQETGTRAGSTGISKLGMTPGNPLAPLAPQMTGAFFKPEASWPTQSRYLLFGYRESKRRTSISQLYWGS